MIKQEVNDYLTAKGVDYEVTEHGPVYTMEEIEALQLPNPEALAKNILVRDDKKEHYYLITVKPSRRVDLNEFRSRFGTRRLSFASETDMAMLLGVQPGAVTPSGLLADAECKVYFYIDAELLRDNSMIGVHPCDNTATVWLSAECLIGIFCRC